MGNSQTIDYSNVENFLVFILYTVLKGQCLTNAATLRV